MNEQIWVGLVTGDTLGKMKRPDHQAQHFVPLQTLRAIPAPLSNPPLRFL